MGELVEEFSRQVNIGGASSWDVCLSNIQRFARHYGISQATVRKRKVRALQQLLHRCNALLVLSPVDDVLWDIQVTLNQALQDLEVISYQQFRMRDKKQQVHDHNFVSHKFFHGLRASHARMNVVRIEVDGTLSTNPQVIIDNCIQHFTKLLGHESILDNDMTKARAMFFQSIKGNVSQQVVMSIEEDIREEEVEYVLSHLVQTKVRNIAWPQPSIESQKWEVEST